MPIAEMKALVSQQDWPTEGKEDEEHEGLDYCKTFGF